MLTIVALLTLSPIITPRLAEAYGKDFSAYEAILGKPDDVYKEDERQDRIWRRKDGSIVDVAKEKGATRVTAVLITFPDGQPRTWKSRLKQIGVGIDKAKSNRVREVANIQGCTKIPSDWTVWWEPRTQKPVKSASHHQDEVILGISHPRIY